MAKAPESKLAGLDTPSASIRPLTYLEEIERELRIRAQLMTDVVDNVPTESILSTALQDPTWYWNNTAATKLGAQLLVRRLNLSFPRPGGFPVYTSPK